MIGHVLEGVAAWCALSLPVGVLFGRAIAAGSHLSDEPAEGTARRRNTTT